MLQRSRPIRSPLRPGRKPARRPPRPGRGSRAATPSADQPDQPSSATSALLARRREPAVRIGPAQLRAVCDGGRKLSVLAPQSPSTGCIARMTNEFKPARRTDARRAGAGVLLSSGATPGIGGESLNTAAEFRSRAPQPVSYRPRSDSCACHRRPVVYGQPCALECGVVPQQLFHDVSPLLRFRSAGERQSVERRLPLVEQTSRRSVLRAFLSALGLGPRLALRRARSPWVGSSYGFSPSSRP